jgi:mannosyltransferase
MIRLFETAVNRALGAILGAGLVLRFLLLGKRQLTTDELTQVLVVHERTFGAMMERLRTGMAVPAPLDYLIQKGVVLLLGESTWSLRLHVALLGVASLWFFFRIARLLFGGRVAFYATTLFALYPLHHHHSQEARPYALLVFLTLLSYDLFLHGVCQKRTGWRFWTLLCVVQVLLLYASFLGLLVMASQFVGLVLAMRLRDAQPPEAVPTPGRSYLSAYVIAAAVACVLFLPWVRFGWTKPMYSPPSEVADPKIALRLLKEVGDNSYPISVLLLAGAGLGGRMLARHGRRRTLAFLLSWLLLSLPVVLVLELWSGYYFAIRHILHSMPPLILLAGYGMAFVGVSGTHAPVRAPALWYAALLLGMLGWTAWVHGNAEPSDWRGAATYLVTHAGDADAVAIPEVYPLVEYYAPSLARFRSEGAEPRAELSRDRFVLCYDKLFPDPCTGFREKALADLHWQQVRFPGFTLFQRAP